MNQRCTFPNKFKRVLGLLKMHKKLTPLCWCAVSKSSPKVLHETLDSLETQPNIHFSWNSGTIKELMITKCNITYK